MNYWWGYELIHQWMLTGKFTWKVPLLGQWLEWQHPGGKPPCDWFGVNYYSRWGVLLVLPVCHRSAVTLYMKWGRRQHAVLTKNSYALLLNSPGSSCVPADAVCHPPLGKRVRLTMPAAACCPPMRHRSVVTWYMKPWCLPGEVMTDMYYPIYADGLYEALMQVRLRMASFEGHGYCLFRSWLWTGCLSFSLVDGLCEARMRHRGGHGIAAG